MIALLALALGAPTARSRAAESDRPTVGAARIERVDLLAEDGTWLLDEAPRLGISPRGTAIRWVEQVRVATAIPAASLVVGLSLETQQLAVRRPLTRRAPVLASVGVLTGLGLPRGASASIEAWAGPARFAVGVAAQSEASWARPVWDGWRPSVGLGVGFGRAPLPW